MSDGSEKKSKKQLRLEKQAADNRAAWGPLQDELHTRREKMRAMGGADRVKKYMHDRGKLDARQRIEALFDDGTFQEIGLLVGTINNIPAEGFVCGSGKVIDATKSDAFCAVAACNKATAGDLTACCKATTAVAAAAVLFQP